MFERHCDCSSTDGRLTRAIGWCASIDGFVTVTPTAIWEGARAGRIGGHGQQRIDVGSSGRTSMSVSAVSNGAASHGTVWVIQTEELLNDWRNRAYAAQS